MQNSHVTQPIMQYTAFDLKVYQTERDSLKTVVF